MVRFGRVDIRRGRQTNNGFGDAWVANLQPRRNAAEKSQTWHARPCPLWLSVPASGGTPQKYGSTIAANRFT
ncbi:MAG TPA: hypothetical protein VHM90_18605, partial [Phycisphaerae bacterium]|nr:hypothetical protein [Phycisphaerae bacterium]